MNANIGMQSLTDAQIETQIKRLSDFIASSPDSVLPSGHIAESVNSATVQACRNLVDMYMYELISRNDSE